MPPSQDGLDALEALLERIYAAKGGSEASDLKQLVRPSGSISQNDLDAINAMAGEKSEKLHGVPVRLCCQALPELCLDVQPPLFPKKFVPKLKKACKAAQGHDGVSVAAICTPAPARKLDGKRCRRSAAFVSRLLELLSSLCNSASDADVASKVRPRATRTSVVTSIIPDGTKRRSSNCWATMRRHAHTHTHVLVISCTASRK